jgi:hypothetical protein
MKSDKDLYRQLRGLPADKLWNEEVPQFNQATPKERMQRVALIRAVGVVFSSSGSTEQRQEVRAWLSRLLQDPSEKIRRYAMAAIPKIGAGATGEGELLSLLKPDTGEREKKFLGRALEKIGGAATLEAVTKTPGLLPQTEQKVKAALARAESPSTIRLDRELADCPGLRIHLRCRKGLENIVRNEVQEFIAKNGKFRFLEFRGRCVALTPIAPFTLGDIYSLRCFDTLGFGLGVVRANEAEASVEALAAIITSPVSRQLFQAFTEGSLRYRLDFVEKGHQRGAVRQVVNRAYALCPEILNDAQQAPWSIDLHPTGHGTSVELRPKITPDPRLYFRTDDVWAASHPPLAACMARLAGVEKGEIVWDPFCGSGLELIECALRGGVKSIHGTDLDAAALAIAQANVTAAKLSGGAAQFTQADFREFTKVAGLGPQSVSLIITNPPMGRRVRVPSLRGLIADLFTAASIALKPGGRLVFPNPLKLEPSDPSLKLQSRQTVDLGGFDCHLEKYLKLSA